MNWHRKKRRALRMAERKYTHGLSVRKEQRTTIVKIGDMEIWDGADLSLLRDALATLVQRDRCRSIGVDMANVKFVPSGFFGMLFDWFEQGISVYVFAPQPRVQNMLWFRLFFEEDRDDRYRLKDSAPVAEQEADAWHREWEQEDRSDRDVVVAI